MRQVSETRIHDLAEKLAAALERDEDPHVFSRKEVSEIQALLRLFRRLEALQWAGKYVLWGLVTAGLIVSNLERIKDFFK